MVNNNYNIILKTPQEQQQLIKENEIMGKILIDIILHNDGVSDERITRLFNEKDWKERVGFSVKDEGEIGWKWVHWWISKPEKIFRRFKREKEELTEKNKEYQKEVEEKSLKIEVLEKKVKELTVFKEQIENLEQNIVGILTKVKEKEDQEITYWEKDEPQELLNNIKKGNLVQTVIRVIKKMKRDVKLHLGFIDSLKELNKEVRDDLNKKTADKTKEVEEKTEKLEKVGNELISKEAKIKELEKQLKERDKRIEKIQNELLNRERKDKEMERNFLEEKNKGEKLWEKYLTFKSLPSLPKKKVNLSKKIKTNLQKLTKKENDQNQEMAAQVEVRTK